MAVLEVKSKLTTQPRIQMPGLLLDPVIDHQTRSMTQARLPLSKKRARIVREEGEQTGEAKEESKAM